VYDWSICRLISGLNVATLRQQIGQMLIMGFQGLDIDDTSPVKHWLTTDGLGGVLLFDFDVKRNQPDKNLKSRDQIRALNQKLKECHKKLYPQDNDTPLFIAIDYEGGAVDRLKHIPGCPTTMTPEQLAKLSETELKHECQRMASTLHDLGFNLNFAPLVDLNLTDKEGIIGKLQRSFSEEPNEVIRVSTQFVKTFAEHGITCCYKHFPGHGSALGDTHLGFVDVTDTFQTKELAPYRKLLNQEQLPAMVMTAHVINRQLDPTGLPATLSRTILTGLLREELGFDGVIISDDLQMSAISQQVSVEEALRLTINAGADMIIFANQLGDISATEVIDLIENLVRLNEIPSPRITEAYQRILRLKKHLQECPTT
jgi:beta-N-acetylhexosaminidase